MKPAVERNCLRISHNHTDVAPFICFHSPPCVCRDLRADFHASHATRKSDSAKQIWETAAWPATHIQNAIAGLELKQSNTLATQRLNPK